MSKTETTIIDEFWKLLDEKPYNKITVNDIANACNINRNTFYYHFHDIPDLLERTVKSRSEYFIENYSSLGEPTNCIVPILKYCEEKKRPILNIYRSVQRETFLNELERLALFLVREYIDKVTEGFEFNEEAKELLIRFYKCIIIGVILDWLNDSMNYDMPKKIDAIKKIMRCLIDNGIFNNLK